MFRVQVEMLPLRVRQYFYFEKAGKIFQNGEKNEYHIASVRVPRHQVVPGDGKMTLEKLVPKARRIVAHSGRGFFLSSFCGGLTHSSS